jgi:hypothetical protein
MTKSQSMGQVVRLSASLWSTFSLFASLIFQTHEHGQIVTHWLMNVDRLWHTDSWMWTDCETLTVEYGQNVTLADERGQIVTHWLVNMDRLWHTDMDRLWHTDSWIWTDCDTLADERGQIVTHWLMNMDRLWHTDMDRLWHTDMDRLWHTDMDRLWHTDMDRLWHTSSWTSTDCRTLDHEHGLWPKYMEAKIKFQCSILFQSDQRMGQPMRTGRDPQTYQEAKSSVRGMSVGRGSVSRYSNSMESLTHLSPAVRYAACALLSHIGRDCLSQRFWREQFYGLFKRGQVWHKSTLWCRIVYPKRNKYLPQGMHYVWGTQQFFNVF